MPAQIRLMATVSVPANDRVEVQFAVSTESAGDARFRATAVSGDLADSATVSLPVYTPVTSEAFATYGTAGVLNSNCGTEPQRRPGLTPSVGWTVQGKTSYEIITKHIEEPPILPHEIDENVPEELSVLVGRMLAKKPEQRFQTMAEVIAALENYLGVKIAGGWEPTEETARQIFEYSRTHLAGYKRVRRIQFTDLPKTISGKIRRVELRRGESANGPSVDFPGEFREEALR